MASVSFTFNRPDGVKNGDVILVERIDMAEGDAAYSMTIYRGASENWLIDSNSAITVSMPNQNTVVATYSPTTLLVEPKATYIPSPY